MRTLSQKIWTLSLALLMTVFAGKHAYSQSMIDLGAGASTMDRYFMNFAYRHQVSDKFRIGFEVQGSSPIYRFVGAKPFEGGYANSLYLPLSFRIAEQGAIRLDGFIRPGYRFQGIVDPDNNDINDSTLQSTAVLFDAGLIVQVRLNDRLNLHSGVLLPAGFETSPESVFEYLGTPNFTAGLSYRAGSKSVLFVKGLTGPAFGADGDTYKYIWSVQAGIRFAFGKKTNNQTLLLEPSF